MDKPSVREVRVAITVEDFEGALGLWRGALGLAVTEEWDRADGRGMILAAGRATIELVDARQAATIDEVEVGRRVSGPVRLALEVGDAAVVAERVATAGGEHLAGPSIRRGAISAPGW
jgi:lactoylglutathione lyase